MQAIVTTYAGPTDTRGSRIIAKADAGRIVVSYDHALSLQDNHRAAAEEYARRKWGYVAERHPLVTGALPKSAAYCHVFAVPGDTMPEDDQ